MIKVTTNVAVSKADAWKYYTDPKHITGWNFANEDWHSPTAENDLKAGGKFSYRMEAKNGSVGFDFSGSFTEVKDGEMLAYTLDDSRTARVSFQEKGESTEVSVEFEPEKENPEDMQKNGWQAILDNFKTYAEAQ